MKHPINDISLCLKDARRLAVKITPARPSEWSLLTAFHSLAGDELTGFLAYVIWRSRSNRLSNL